MRARHVATAVLALAGIVGGIAAAGPADARVRSVQAPARVVIAGPTTTIPATVRVTARTPLGGYAASVWLGDLDAGRFVQVGAAAGDTRTLTVRARVPSVQVRPGTSTLLAVDEGDGLAAAFTVDARRKSRARLTHADPAGNGRVRLAARVTHYSVAADRFVSSRLSPVRFQALRAGEWVTVAAATTTPDGLAGAIVSLPPGPATLRVVRLDGVTVWGATSRPLTVTVAAR